MASQSVNAKGSIPKIRRVFEIMEKYKPVNFGDVKSGNIFKVPSDTMKENLKENSYIHFVFTDRETVKQVLQELKKEDIGLSVVVSGVVEEIDHICKEVGLQMHTVEFSGGIFGRKESLPETPILEVTTMCGHGLISNALVRHLIERIKKGKLSIHEAAIELAKQCQCGVFNPKRAEALLAQLCGRDRRS